MAVRIIRSGMLSTIQDKGRFGYSNQGIPVAGAMDLKSLQQANILLGNEPYEAAIECTMMGPEIEFLSDCLFTITGADMEPKLNGSDIPLYRVLLGRKGDHLSMGVARKGVRSYLAFAGGLKIPSILGSKSTDLRCGTGGFNGRRLLDQDVIELMNPKISLPNMYKRYENIMIDSQYEIIVRVMLGPQRETFTEQGIQTFLSTSYRILEDSNRMGYRLDGETIEYRDSVDIISDGIVYGSIQVTTSGMPIVMMADHQTTGGYAKIATVISTDLPLLAQQRVGTYVRFQEVSIKEAIKIARRERRVLKRFKRDTN